MTDLLAHSITAGVAVQREALVTFDDVSFGYEPDAAPVLAGVSLAIREGDHVALVGPSGSGKSSILNLLNRLEHGYTGSITVAGRELRDIPGDDVNALMTLVAQDPFILRRSVFDNISFGRDVTRSEVESAARLANAHEFIASLSDGYDTTLSEGGTSLSGGQRQRICLARAIVQLPRVLLLDEPTSGLDNQSQRVVHSAIRKLHGITIVEVAHRLTAVREVDHVLVVEGGRIVQAGSYAELAMMPGLFSDMLALE